MWRFSLGLALSWLLVAAVGADEPPKSEIIELPLRPASAAEPGQTKRLIYLPTEQISGNAALIDTRI